MATLGKLEDRKLRFRGSTRIYTDQKRFNQSALIRTSVAKKLASYISISPKPFCGAAEGVIHRRDSPFQLALGFSRRNEHFLPSHADGVYGRTRFTTTNAAGEDLIHHSGCQRKRIRHTYFGRGKTGDRCQLVENLLQREILATQNVTLARAPFVERRNMPASAFGDIHEVEAGVDIGREFLLQEIDDDASGWGRLDVAL